MKKNLKVIGAKEFKSYIDDFDSPYAMLQGVKTQNNVLRRMSLNGSHLIVPVGKDAWGNLKYRETIHNVFLFWEDYMSEISPFLFSKESQNYDGEDILDVTFKYRNFTKDFSADCAGAGLSSFAYEENGKSKSQSFFTFKFNLESLNFGNCTGPIPSMPQKTLLEQSNTDDLDESESIREFRNPWPRFISTPMGGMNKWRRR